MIPSKYSIVEAYRKEGRINAKAMYRVLGVTEEQARRRHADASDEFIVDACMFADEYLPSFFKEGASEEEVRVCIDKSLFFARGRHTYGGGTSECACVREYMCQCVEDYLNSSKRAPANRYSNMLNSIIEEMHLKSVEADSVRNFLSYRFLPRLVCGVTKEQLRVLVNEFLYAPNPHKA